MLLTGSWRSWRAPTLLFSVAGLLKSLDLCFIAQQTLAPLGKRLKGRHQPSASRQALGGSRRLEALGTAPAPLGKRLESLGTAPAPLGKRLEGLGTVPAPLGKRLETLTDPSAKLGNNCSVLLM